MLKCYYYFIWAKSDPSFLTEWTLFLNIYMFFAWIFICRLHRGYKNVSTKPVSVITSQLFWWTNYSVMSHCYLYLCFGEGPLLHVFYLQHFISYFYLAHCFQLFSSATISFLHCPSCNVGPKWESLVILARISFSSRHRRRSVALAIYV